MFSHITVGVGDLERAGQFYDAVLAPLGLTRRPVQPDGGPLALCWHKPSLVMPRFYAYKPFNGEPSSAGNGGMVAFLAPSPEAVRSAHAAGLNAGGQDDGTPGERPNYGPGYYGAYLRDPDGNKIHLAFRGDLVHPGTPA